MCERGRIRGGHPLSDRTHARGGNGMIATNGGRDKIANARTTAMTAGKSLPRDKMYVVELRCDYKLRDSLYLCSAL
jgi:hypothetical protein